MTVQSLRRSYRLCAGVLVAGLTLQETASAQTTNRTVPNNYSCYNTEVTAISDWNTVDMSAFSQATQKAGGQSLRLAGGDTANYWDWDTGSIVDWYVFDDATNNFVSRKPNVWPYFLPQELPDNVRYEYNNHATLANVEPLISNTGAEPIWVMNMNTSTLDKELRHLQEAAALGMPVTRVELGNELYFRGGPNTPAFEFGNYERADYGGAPPQKGGYPNPSDYAADAKRWADAVKAVFPNAKIAITGAADSNNPSPRINGWLSALQAPIGNDGRSAMDAVDAFTIHPYYSAASLGVTKADVGNSARAGAIARDGIAQLRGILADPGINAPAMQNKKLWITEHNILETDVVVLGNSWVGSLMLDMHGHEFLKDARTEISCAHVLTGNPQWQAIAGEEGTVIDPSKRGIDDQPFSNLAEPFSQTASGLVLGKSANIFTEGTATLLHSGDASIAWRVENSSADTISAINAGDLDVLLTLPTGKIWEVLTFKADPWATVTQEDDLDIALERITGGTTITLSAFTKLIARTNPTVRPPQPPDDEAESVPEPAAVLGFGLMAAALSLSRRQRESLMPMFSRAAE